jgi:hypothetical protein
MPTDEPAPGLPEVMYHDFAVRLATLVRATEVAGFQVLTTRPLISLRPIVHVRPDMSSDAQRAEAIRTFQDIVAPCLERRQDGAIQLLGSEEADESWQYCLVTLTRDSTGFPCAVTAFICRCSSQGDADRKLRFLQGYS